jgi:hypothetical protein
VSSNEFGLGAFVCAEHLENGNEVVIGKVGVIACEESIDVAAGQACAFGEITLHEIPPFCFALKCYSKITHEIAYANGSWFATFARKTGRNFFVQTVSKYGIATELQSRIEEEEPAISAELFREAKRRDETAKGHEGTRKLQTDFFPEGKATTEKPQNSSTFFSNFYFHPQQQRNRNDTKTHEGIFERSKVTKKPGV